jgi:hypothetical protein
LVSWQTNFHFDRKLWRRLDVAADLIEPEKKERKETNEWMMDGTNGH